MDKQKKQSTSIEEADHPSDAESRLGLLNFYQEQLKLHREIMDRWFGNYLLIIGAPFPVIGALLQLDIIKTSISSTFSYLGIICLFFFILGLHFLFIHVRQRIAAIRFARKIMRVESFTLKSIIAISEERPSQYKLERMGADFGVGSVYIFINSIWLASAIYFLCSLAIMWILLVFLGGIVLQHLLRYIGLRKHEKNF